MNLAAGRHSLDKVIESCSRKAMDCYVGDVNVMSATSML